MKTAIRIKARQSAAALLLLLLLMLSDAAHLLHRDSIPYCESRNRAFTCFIAGVETQAVVPVLVVETPEASKCSVTKAFV